MRAEEAGKLVAKFIDRAWPKDKEIIYEVIKLAINKAWQEGKWLGMTSEFFVRVQKEDCGNFFFVAPTSHPILLAINGNSLGLPIRDQYFMFHRNGYGDIRNRTGCHWNQDVYDLPYVPVYRETPKAFRVGVRSLGVVGPDERVMIHGSHRGGGSVYTYRQEETRHPCGSITVDPEKTDVLSGIEIPVSTGFNYINNIIFDDIRAINKTITQSAVEVIVIDECDKAYPVARMEPFSRSSKYRKYLVPEPLCGQVCLHALFKIAQQEDILGPNDPIMITNEEALISLAKGIHNIYYKDQLELGASYILQGISVLDKEIREEESPTEFPIQVANPIADDLGILKDAS